MKGHFMAEINAKANPEEVFPRLPASEFTRERYIVENEVSTQTGRDMLELRGWKCIGWAFSKEVGQGANWRYVCMFEREEGGQKYWNQIPTPLFVNMADIFKSRPPRRS
jgi:hypothetical protein